MKWYNTFTFLFGAIVSFADPITDMLTLVTFYRAGETTWFALGLVFVILPCFANVSIDLLFGHLLNPELRGRKLTLVILKSCHPFYQGIIRLKAFFFCFKHFRSLWRGSIADSDESLLYDIGMFVSQDAHAGTAEALAESAPQFILQLYAMSIQTKPVEVIQMISLPISFLSLVWTLTNANVTRFNEEPIDLMGQVRYFLWTACLVGSRLFVTAYFTVTFKWWIMSVLGFHVLLMMVWSRKSDLFDMYSQGGSTLHKAISRIGFATQIWLFFRFNAGYEDIFILHYAMCMIENIGMILVAYYFTLHLIAWYSLPVTVAVCVLSVLTTAGAAHLVIPRMCRDPRMDLERYDPTSDERNYNTQPSQNALMALRIQNNAQTKVVCENTAEIYIPYESAV